MQAGSSRLGLRITAFAAVGALAIGGLAACGSGDDGGGSGSTSGTSSGGEKVKIGLITKTETNPFFVKMKEGAQAEAAKVGAEVQSFAGKKDGDNETQVAAVETLIAAGAKGILITPSDSKRSTRRPSHPTRPTPRSPPTTSPPAS
jgi:fructose transport system substrate-binding protein